MRNQGHINKTKARRSKNINQASIRKTQDNYKIFKTSQYINNPHEKILCHLNKVFRLKVQ